MPIIGTVASQLINRLGPSVQYYFERIYNSTKNAAGVRAVRDSAGNIYYCMQSATNGTGGYYATLVTKTNNAGEIQWSKYWTNQGYNFDIGIDSNENLYVGTQESNRKPAYIKISKSTGLQIGSGVYYDTGITYRGGCVLDSDGNIWGAGSVNPNNNLNGPHIVPSSLTGNMSIYGVAGTYADAVVACPNGNIATLGTDTSGNGYRPFLISSTKGGSFNWAKYWGSNYSSGGYGNLATDASSNIYVGSWIADSGQAGAYGMIMKFNPSGDLTWQKTLDLNTSTLQTLNGIDVDVDGNVYVCGTDNNAGVNTGILAKFNSSGTVQWQRSITKANLNTVKVLSTGELMITGQWIGLAQNGGEQPLVIRVPADGSKTGTYTIGGSSVAYAASSYTIANGGFSPSTLTGGWANTLSLSPNSYTPTINDYNPSTEIVSI
jgi:hypothetical protein